MVPLIELRGAIPISQGFHLPLLQSYIICILGNMLPVPVIYLFARKVLEWGKDKPLIGKFFTFCLEKGEKGGKETAGKGRTRIVCCVTALCGNPGSGNRSMDWHTGRQHTGYGF